MMKWIRYGIAALSFMLFSSASFAGLDPIGWNIISGSFPTTVIPNLTYPDITYRFVNNNPFRMPTPLYITKYSNTPEITFVADNCSGRYLNPGEPCFVTIHFFFTSLGTKVVSLTEEYGRNKVPLPVLSSTSASGPNPLVTGRVTIPLPASMGAGGEAPFQFTYTNTNNGTVTGVVSSTVTVNPNAGGGVATVGSDTCALLVGNNLAPGQSCTVTGTFQTGIAGNYTVNHHINYNGGTGITSLSTSTTAVQQITGVASTPLPTSMGAGEEQTVGFTFTNTGTLPTTPITSVVVTGTGGTISPLTDTCTGVPILAGASCTVTKTFSSGVPATNYSATATLNYAGGSVVVTTPTPPATATGTIKVTGLFNPGLPSSTGTGERNNVVVTYTNGGTGVAYGIQNPTSGGNFVVTGGSCTSVTTDCGVIFPVTLNPGASCSVTCNSFEAVSPGTATISSHIVYGAGPTPAVTTTSAVTQKVVAAVPIPLPSSADATLVYPVRFTFTNTGSADVYGVTTPTITYSPLTTAHNVPVFTNCGPGTLSPATACTVDIEVGPNPAGSYTVFASFTYDGGTLNTSTSTTTSFARKFTINNYCDKDIWFSFDGDPVRKGCSDKNPCPNNSTCNKTADEGRGVCYWNNPLSDKNGFHMTPMINSKPSTTMVKLQSFDSKNNTLWSGRVIGRTNDVTQDSLSTMPTTAAQFTLMRKDADKYAVRTDNGINLTMSMGPTDSSQYQSSAPYYCATPGSADASKIVKACSWMLTPPAYPNTSAALNYIWVKPGVGGACSTNSCPTSEVCGLTFNNGKFAQVCGKQLGYWTASRACLLNASSASNFFDCQTSMSQLRGDLLQSLNACTNDNHQSQDCAGVGNRERAMMIQWIKSACSSVATFPGDKMSNIFTCESHEKKANQKDNEKINVTDYTISFCPEMAPNSPFRTMAR